MSELKPCPFCGGEATPKLAPYIGGGGCGYIVDCDECWSKTGYYSQKAEAIEAWNTRACPEDGAIIATEENMAAYGWVRERSWFQCSACGAVSLEVTPMYCPVCGAKVVEE